MGASAVQDFNKGASLLPMSPKNLDIPAWSPNVPGGNFSMPIRFFKSEQGSKKLPTVIVGTGYDATQEDLYHGTVIGALERGWNVITYEGPGQPTVLREQKIGFIPDWWNVVSPIVDYLEGRNDVDLDKIALVGVSFGGSLAPIAASREHRLAAVLAIDGLTSIYDTYEAGLAAANLTDIYDKGHFAEFD